MDKQVNVIFREKQRFAAWVHAINFFILVFSTTILYVSFKAESAKGNPPDKGDIFPLMIGIGLPVILEILFMFLKLETEVRSNGLYVRLFPIHINFKTFAQEEITQAYARIYKPLSEYGGWGIKGSPKNKAYNTRGKEGVQLIFNNGKKLLIGSQKPNELENAIKSIMGN